jgi:hypothetical protein
MAMQLKFVRPCAIDTLVDRSSSSERSRERILPIVSGPTDRRPVPTRLRTRTPNDRDGSRSEHADRHIGASVTGPLMTPRRKRANCPRPPVPGQPDRRLRCQSPSARSGRTGQPSAILAVLGINAPYGAPAAGRVEHRSRAPWLLDVRSSSRAVRWSPGYLAAARGHGASAIHRTDKTCGLLC